MSRHEFIYSNKSVHRLSRHLSFLVIYSIYFYLQSISPDCIKELRQSNVFSFALTSVYCFLPVCIASVYIFLYILLPLVQREKYARFCLGVIALYIGATTVNYFFSVLFLKISCNCDTGKIVFLRKFALGYTNAQNAIIAGAVVSCIKLAANWYRQNKENILLAGLKVQTELRLMKTSIHPRFLFNSLDSISNNIQAGAPQSAHMILKLSDLLSYTLYECDDELVPLEKELSVMQEYIALEKIKQPVLAVINMEIIGDPDNKYIAPLILLPFLQNIFDTVYRNATEPLVSNLGITIESGKLCFELSVNAFKNSAGISAWTGAIQATRIRLDIQYPDNYQLGITESGEKTIILLEILLTSQHIMAGEFFQPEKRDRYEFA